MIMSLGKKIAKKEVKCNACLIYGANDHAGMDPDTGPGNPCYMADH
jgi:hypothetical protein